MFSDMPEWLKILIIILYVVCVVLQANEYAKK
jgi:hypothetical protein